jgi:transketolase
VLNAVANGCPELVGGSADLSGSNCTFLDVSGDDDDDDDGGGGGGDVV